MCTCECTYAWSPEEDDAFSGDGAIESFVWLDVGSRTEPRLFARIYTLIANELTIHPHKTIIIVSLVAAIMTNKNSYYI